MVNDLILINVHFWKKCPSWPGQLILDLISLFPLLYKPETATSLSFAESQSQFGALKITLVSLLYSPVLVLTVTLFYEVVIFPSPSQVYMTWLSTEISTAMTHKVQYCHLVVWKLDCLPDTNKIPHTFSHLAYEVEALQNHVLKDSKLRSLSGLKFMIGLYYFLLW